MEADSSTPANPLSREEIKEQRRARNKSKREQKRAEKKAHTPQLSNDLTKNATNGHVALVTRDVFEHINNESAGSDASRRKCRPIVDIVELGTQQQHYYAVLKTLSKLATESNVKTEDHTVTNKLDKAGPVIMKGKHSEKPKPKQLSSLKKAIVAAVNESDSSSYHNYINNITSEQLELFTCNFIKKLVELQEKYFKREPNKAAIKRRYVIGFHQLKKYILLKKIKLFVIAADIKLHHKDPLHLLIEELMCLADGNGIPYIFALKRRQIGRLSLKQVPVTCFGVLNFDGLNEEFKTLLEEIASCKMTAK